MLCNFFGSVVKFIKYFTWPYISWDSMVLWSVFDRIDWIILKYNFHLSIISSKQNVRHTEKFPFRFETLKNVIN